jgi:hypothetical protein
MTLPVKLREHPYWFHGNIHAIERECCISLLKRAIFLAGMVIGGI